jgi:hypothetical protein
MNKEIEAKAEVIFNKHSFAALGAISPSKHFCIKAMLEMYESALKGIDLDRVVYVPTSVEDELPKDESDYFVITPNSDIIKVLYHSGTKNGNARWMQEVKTWLRKTTIGELINHK